MVAIIKSTPMGVQSVDEITAGSWLNLVAPTSDEVARVQRELNIPPDFLSYALDMDERPRIEKEDGTTLILLRVPHFQGDDADLPYTTVPLSVILVGEVIVTVCRVENGVIQGLAAGRVKGLSTARKSRFVLHLLHNTATQYLAYLREINRTVEQLEDRLQLAMKNRELLELLKHQKSLVYFTTALKGNELMMERLRRSLLGNDPDDEDLLEDVLTENQQAIEMVGIASNILSQMMGAFASVISNNLNVVMKFLASVTIVLALPTMIASLYGMNIELPLQGLPHAFPIVLGFCVLASLVVALVFWKRDWF